MYYKTLQIRNARQMDRFLNKLVPYIVHHKHTNVDKTVAYYGIRTLRIHNFL
jgi:hypothetical protein